MKRVLDGDSVVLTDGAQLRYIGIDAPERGDPFAEESRAWNRRMVGERTIRIERGEEERDRYGRILAYVWVRRGGEEVFVNEEILRVGLARAYPYFPNVLYRDRFAKAQTEARRARRGVWSVERSGVAGIVVGSTTRFHRIDCQHVPEIGRPLRFESREAAFDAGLSACRTCRP